MRLRARTASSTVRDRAPFTIHTNIKMPQDVPYSDEDDISEMLAMDLGVLRLAPQSPASQREPASPAASKVARIRTWSEGVRTQTRDEPPPPVLQLAKFRFPPKAKYDNWKHQEDPMINVILNAGAPNFDVSPLIHVKLLSLNEIPKNSRIPSLIIKHHDIVGNRRLCANSDGFMYYDPNSVALKTIIDRRAVAVPCDDVVLNAPACFTNHAVRVFVQASDIINTEEASKFEYIGEYYLHKTERTLSHDAWIEVDEDIKQVLVERSLTTMVASSDDPNPGNTYSAKNIRRWYDLGDVCPLIVLRRAPGPKAMTLNKATKYDTLARAVHHVVPILNDNPELFDSASEYSQESEVLTEDDNEDDMDLGHPGVNASFSFPRPEPERRATASTIRSSGDFIVGSASDTEDENEEPDLSESTVHKLRAADTAEVAAMGEFMASMADLRWQDGMVCWRMMLLLQSFYAETEVDDAAIVDVGVGTSRSSSEKPTLKSRETQRRFSQPPSLRSSRTFWSLRSRISSLRLTPIHSLRNTTVYVPSSFTTPSASSTPSSSTTPSTPSTSSSFTTPSTSTTPTPPSPSLSPSLKSFHTLPISRLRRTFGS